MPTMSWIKKYLIFFVVMVVGNDFVLIFVLLNQTNYDKHIQNIQ